MSLLEAEEVAPARSPISHRSTESPRPAASRAMPTPLIPPPTMRRSTGADGRDARAGIRLPRGAAHPLAMGDVDAARDNERSAAPGPCRRQRAENEIAEERRPDDLTVGEWCQQRGGAAHEAGDQKVLAAGVEATHRDDQRPIGGACRPPDEGEGRAAEHKAD